MSITTKTLDQQDLNNAVARCVSLGWTVQSSTQNQVILHRGVNHGLHLFASVMTLGLWLPIYFIWWAATKDRKIVLTLEERL